MGSARVQPYAPRPAGRPQDNLPLERTSFVGREREVAEILGSCALVLYMVGSLLVRAMAGSL